MASLEDPTTSSLRTAHREQMWIIQPQRYQTSQSTLLGKAGGFQRMNGGPESWRDGVTHWERVKGWRTLCLKRRWTGGKAVSKSWSSRLEHPRSWQLRFGQWKPIWSISQAHVEQAWIMSQILEVVPVQVIISKNMMKPWDSKIEKDEKWCQKHGQVRGLPGSLPLK